MPPRHIDLDLIALDETAAQQWRVTLRHQMPWLMAHQGEPPSLSLMKVIGTGAHIRSSHQLALTAVARLVARHACWYERTTGGGPMPYEAAKLGPVPSTSIYST